MPDEMPYNTEKNQQKTKIQEAEQMNHAEDNIP